MSRASRVAILMLRCVSVKHRLYMLYRTSFA